MSICFALYLLLVLAKVVQSRHLGRKSIKTHNSQVPESSLLLPWPGFRPREDFCSSSLLSMSLPNHLSQCHPGDLLKLVMVAHKGRRRMVTLSLKPVWSIV